MVLLPLPVPLLTDRHLSQVDLSLRPSRTLGVGKVVDREIDSIHDVKQGSVLRGYIKNVTDNGCFVSLVNSFCLLFCLEKEGGRRHEIT